MNYLFGTGLIGAITAGASLLRGSRDTPITWRAVLAWVSWGITLALAIGSVIDTYRSRQGRPVADDSPLTSKKAKKSAKTMKKAAKQLGNSAN
ncbi:hypothetical protein [Microbacterium saperdae]|uniref:Uncharacterized protein n=1 Tax=Microbacterium saperdae TaxID=69368 RepID=A0A543BNI2_9MICO|nr:hypothetical protein [Microbacterium saperdae]TQL86382.1 hypothetical protein FB560_2039 [Microbacterium saperdae]GGM48403.1 hypothetical protein GCM10010489_19760 [Microbacterium saperdae]